ncbi:MAG: flagellar hook-basal body complex protein FliE [Lachnospiraceae bacterium]|nr:flagellar hook-basal body complex protein FliE [Lachnospiraceae bacterium]
MSEMFITPIQPMKIGDGITSAGQSGTQAGVSAFKGIFENAVNNVKTTEDDLVNKQFLLATGQIEDAHSVMIAASEAQIAVDMLVSLRNKALDAYNEIMRISL